MFPSSSRFVTVSEDFHLHLHAFPTTLTSVSRSQSSGSFARNPRKQKQPSKTMSFSSIAENPSTLDLQSALSNNDTVFIVEISALHQRFSVVSCCKGISSS